MLGSRVALLLLLTYAGGNTAFGQSGTQNREIRHWPEINLNILAVDMSGQPDTTLDKSAFRLFEDGVERSLESVVAEDAPVSVALLIDTSGSTKDSMAATASVATAIIQSLPDASEVMAVLFADEASIGQPFTSAHAAPLSFLNQLQAHGGTSFYDALIVSEAYVAAHAQFARRALVVLSDGGDNASRHKLQDAVRSLQQPGTPTVYFVVQPEPRASGFERSRTERIIKTLVSADGGVMILPTKDQGPALLGQHIAALIRSQYSVNFTASDPATDGKSHKLEVRVERPKLKICVMPLYFAPAK